MWWNPGDVLQSPIAFDTETALGSGPLDVPRMALASASDGKRSVLIHPDDLAAFLTTHKRHTFLAFNVGFDFWVVDQELRRQGYGATPGDPSRVLWDASHNNRLYCLRMLYRLIVLGTEGDAPRKGTLADVVARFAPQHKVDKKDPYRLRYGELIGKSKDAIVRLEDGFRLYALADAEATRALWEPMHACAVSIMREAGWNPDLKAGRTYEIRPDAYRKWGPLSLAIQTRAAIVFDRLSREPWRTDAQKVSGMVQATKARIAELADYLESECPGLWNRYKRANQHRGIRPGDFQLSKTSGLRKRDNGILADHLVGIAKTLGFRVPLSSGKKAGVSLSADDWSGVESPFIAAWIEYDKLKGQLGKMLLPMATGEVYADYEPLLKTGRTSAQKHTGIASLPIQQVPRDPVFRQLFLADPGTELLTIDYSYLELRTLAANCEARFGFSFLGDVIREHTKAVRAGKGAMMPDPHEVMAAAILGVPPPAYMALPKDQRKPARQKAKPVNFGFPGGLGARKFVLYAALQYGQTVTLAEAKALRKKWMDTYPEMKRWLVDGTARNLAKALRIPESRVTAKFGRYLWPVREAIEGVNVDEDRTKPIIDKLHSVCKDPAITKMLASFDFSTLTHQELSSKLLKGASVTLTGRVRAKCGYSEAANHPFQAVAADGAKEAAWRLMYEGFHLKAFIHDEIVIALPEGPQVPSQARRVASLMNRAMEDVMSPKMGMPCETEYHVASHWVKG